jgi:hypothetical protein
MKTKENKRVIDKIIITIIIIIIIAIMGTLSSSSISSFDEIVFKIQSI